MKAHTAKFTGKKEKNLRKLNFVLSTLNLIGEQNKIGSLQNQGLGIIPSYLSKLILLAPRGRF